MDGWKQYIFSVIVCALSCGIISQIVSDANGKKLVQMACGLVLTISLLQPLSRLNIADFLSVPQWDRDSADTCIAEGKEAASEARGRYIKSSCEAYILDKAKALQTDITAEVFLDEALIPVFVEIEGSSDSDVQMEMERVLTEDLGIPKENQKWIWNQESNTS